DAGRRPPLHSHRERQWPGNHRGRKAEPGFSGHPGYEGARAPDGRPVGYLRRKRRRHYVARLHPNRRELSRRNRLMRKVLIVDDHEVVRDGVKRLLEEQPGAIACGEAGTPEEAIGMALAVDWDAVVLDLSFAGKGWLEV